MSRGQRIVAATVSVVLLAHAWMCATHCDGSFGTATGCPAAHGGGIDQHGHDHPFGHHGTCPHEAAPEAPSNGDCDHCQGHDHHTWVSASRPVTATPTFPSAAPFSLPPARRISGPRCAPTPAWAPPPTPRTEVLLI